MPLAPGTKLGPYEIATPLGVGGMGEVYRAKDTRLDRTVAIKILPAQFSLDPVHKQRFEREAKTISSLSHPHICPLYDVGQQDGADLRVGRFISTVRRQVNNGRPCRLLFCRFADNAIASENAQRTRLLFAVRPRNAGRWCRTKGGARHRPARADRTFDRPPAFVRDPDPSKLDRPVAGKQDS